MLQEFAQWLENETAWVIGTTLFVGHLPLKTTAGGPVPERYVLLLENTPAGVVGDLPDYLDKEIQVMNVARSYFTARADAVAIFNRLHGRTNLTLPVLTSGEEYLVMVADAVASPAPIINPDEKGIFRFSTNYILRTENLVYA
jgi:hypothetical protein